jgi:hypothetical protein
MRLKRDDHMPLSETKFSPQASIIELVGSVSVLPAFIIANAACDCHIMRCIHFEVKRLPYAASEQCTANLVQVCSDTASSPSRGLLASFLQPSAPINCPKQQLSKVFVDIFSNNYKDVCETCKIDHLIFNVLIKYGSYNRQYSSLYLPYVRASSERLRKNN